MSKNNTLVVMGKIPGSTAHVTFAFKYECTEQESLELQNETHSLFNDLLPLTCKIGNIIMVGHNKDMPAYDIIVPNTDQNELLVKYWDKYQRRKPGDTSYNMNLHATLKDEQKAKTMKTLKNNNEGIFQIKEVIIRTLKDKVLIKKISV